MNISVQPLWNPHHQEWPILWHIADLPHASYRYQQQRRLPSPYLLWQDQVCLRQQTGYQPCACSSRDLLCTYDKWWLLPVHVQSASCSTARLRCGWPRRPQHVCPRFRYCTVLVIPLPQKEWRASGADFWIWCSRNSGSWTHLHPYPGESSR